MRVVVQIPDGYREVQEDLQNYAPRARAERIRMLTAIGLAALRGGLGGTANSQENGQGLARQNTTVYASALRRLQVGLFGEDEAIKDDGKTEL